MTCNSNHVIRYDLIITFLHLFYYLTCFVLYSDLSFNNIEVIEGLEQLTKLEDLTLYSNRISKIENMDNLENLQVLSVGNNILKDLENVRSYL